LFKNLEDNRSDSGDVEFILVDFDSKDGLKDCVKDTFENELKSGYLRYYYTNKLPYWHASIAKNTAHYLAKNEILVNLDCDNYTGYRGGRFVIEQFENDSNIVLHQFGKYGDGSYGRIAMMKKYFDEAGGYDESFEPMSCQDADLIARLQIFGLKYLRINHQEYCKAETNTKEESIINTNSAKSWEEMERINRKKLSENIRKGNYIANNGYYGMRNL
jgi:hypothetical protein